MSTIVIRSVIQAVTKFKNQLEKEGAKVDISNVNYSKLEEDIQREYACGADGSVYNVIVDLNDSVGLDEYGITITQ